jgi:hypothetical protein
VFEDDGSGAPVKKMAGYHQFHAVQMAVAETLRAAELRRSRPGLRGHGWLRGRPAAWREAPRPAHWRGLAHAGLGEEPHHGLLCGARRRGERGAQPCGMGVQPMGQTGRRKPKDRSRDE